MNNKSVTIHELAKAAGVSIASVSRALNGKPGISDALRARILALCEEVNYQPNLMAKRLISGAKPVVALCMPSAPHEFSDRPYFVHLYQALTILLHSKGLVPVLFPFENRENAVHQAGSAILLGAIEDGREAFFRQHQIPFVSLEFGSGAAVLVDDSKGVYDMTCYLAGKGRHSILFLDEIIDSVASQSRLRGYQAAMAELNMVEQAKSIERKTSSVLDAYRFVRKLIESGNFPYDAIVCANDEMATGTVEALKDMGIEVPQQVAVTGFDDLPHFSDHITTIHQDIPTIAESIVTLLGEQLEGKPERVIKVPTRAVFRDSA